MRGAGNLAFGEVARLRDQVKRLQAVELAIADDPLARQSVVEDAVEEAVKARGRSTGGRGGMRGGRRGGGGEKHLPIAWFTEVGGKR